MNAYFKNFILILSLLLTGATGVLAQEEKDSCNVESFVRADGVMLRKVNFEPIYNDDTLKVFAAMYSIDKEYFVVVRIQTNKKVSNYNKDIVIQLSDSTNILAPFDSFKSDRSKKTYDGYFKINSKDLGYIEKYTLVRIKYYIKDQIRILPVQQGSMILQRHYACLRNT